MVMLSAVGLTVTVTVTGVLAGTPAIELVATTEKFSTRGVVSGGTFGAMNVCVEPSPAVGVRVTGSPLVCVQVKVSVPPFGSTPLAARVTVLAPSPTTGFGFAFAVTPGGVLGGATLMGTDRLAVDGVFTPACPTVSCKVRLSGAATAGAMNVAVALSGLVMVMIGSPVLTTCCQWNGPASGKLPRELSVTSVPAITGVAEAVKLATAWAALGSPGTQAWAGGAATLSGQGLSWPTNCGGRG